MRTRACSTGILLLVILFGIFVAEADGLNRVYIHPSGSDQNDCSSLELQCRSINKALNALTEAGIIEVGGGIYSGVSNVAQTVIAAHAITIQGSYFTPSVFLGNGSSHCLEVTGSESVVLDRLTYMNCLRTYWPLIGHC